MRWKESAKNMVNLYSLVLMSLLLALRVVFELFTTIQIGDYLKIDFSVFLTAYSCMIFGPVPGIVMGGAADILCFLLKPTGPYFFGFTLSKMIAGMIYGLFFYKRKMTPYWRCIVRVFFTVTLVTIVVNLCMNTIWICLLYGVKDLSRFVTEPSAAMEAFMIKLRAGFWARLLKEGIMIPVNTAVVSLVFIVAGRIPLNIPGMNSAGRNTK